MEKFLQSVSKNPTVLFGCIGVLCLLLVYLRLRKVNLSTRVMAHVGLAVAMATVLHAMKIYQMPQGGSVTLGGMVPLLLLSFLYGPSIGMLAGFLYGIVDLVMNPYIYHPVQVIFDYPLPYMFLGLAGYFTSHRMLGVAAGISGRFICHFISGVVFFASYAPPGMSPYLYSFLFNASYLGAECVISMAVIRFLPIDRLREIAKGKM